MKRTPLVVRLAAYATLCLLNGCGGSYTAAKSATPTSTPPPTPAPAASITASPATISIPQSATLTWTTSNASSVTISGIGTVAASGSISVTPTQTTAYTLTATGAGGTQTATAAITVQPLKVVFIGDSLLGGDWSGTEIQTYFPAFTTINKGIGGNTTDQMLARFQPDVINQNPDLVLIWGSDNGDGVSMTSAQIENDWASMISLAQNAHIGVVIATISPRGVPVTTTGNPSIRALDSWLTSYTNSDSVVLADVYPILVDSNDELQSQYNLDGTHLTDAGHAALVPLFTSALVSAAQQIGK